MRMSYTISLFWVIATYEYNIYKKLKQINSNIEYRNSKQIRILMNCDSLLNLPKIFDEATLCQRKSTTAPVYTKAKYSN